MKEIVRAGNPILRAIAREVAPSEIAGAHIQSVIQHMKDVLALESLGVAIAAPQIGESLRIFVVSKKVSKRSDRNEDEELPDTTAREDMVFINPVLTRVSKRKIQRHEGCLSVRGKWGHVMRSEKVTLKAFDAHGKKVLLNASGLLAHIFQHEVDHLDGVLYTDKAEDVYDDVPEGQQEDREDGSLS